MTGEFVDVHDGKKRETNLFMMVYNGMHIIWYYEIGEDTKIRSPHETKYLKWTVCVEKEERMLILLLNKNK